MVNVRYFIPEDGDIEEQPNVFVVANRPTLGQIKESFPLPGQYHFRFKTPLTAGADREKGQFGVWMDCVDDRKPVPTWQNNIIAKVTRVGIDEDEDFDDDEDFDRRASIAGNFGAHELAHGQPAAPAAHSMPPRTNMPVDILGGGGGAPATNHHMSTPPNNGGSGDLLGGFGSGGAPAANHGGAGDLLGQW